jgi:hypothetical protein
VGPFRHILILALSPLISDPDGLCKQILGLYAEFCTPWIGYGQLGRCDGTIPVGIAHEFNLRAFIGNPLIGLRR